MRVEVIKGGRPNPTGGRPYARSGSLGAEHEWDQLPSGRLILAHQGPLTIRCALQDTLVDTFLFTSRGMPEEVREGRLINLLLFL